MLNLVCKATHAHNLGAAPLDRPLGESIRFYHTNIKHAKVYIVMLAMINLSHLRIGWGKIHKKPWLWYALITYLLI